MDVELPSDFERIPDPLRGGAIDAHVPPMAPPSAPSLTRAGRRGQLGGLAVAALGWVTGFVVFFGIRADLSDFRVLVQLGGLLGLLALAVRGLRSPGRLGLGLPPGALRGLVLSVPVVYVGLALGTASAEPEPPLVADLLCLGISSAMALGPLVALGFLYERRIVVSPGWRGAGLGLAAGLVGSFGIQAHCTLSQPVHGLLGHGAVLLVATGLGALAASRRGPA